MDDVVKSVELIKIGDKEFDAENVTPSVYFDYVKGLKKELDKKEYEIIIDGALEMLEKTKLTGQTEMAKQLTHHVELALRELEAAEKGFNIYVDRQDIERYLEKVENKSIKVIELKRYPREIPDEVIEKLAMAKEIFDELYVVFTDYTLAETKKVAKERRDKDPILFGAFKDDSDKDEKNKIYVEDRFFFIADWVEELCDLTLEQIVRDIQNKENKDITYRIDTPQDIESVKKMINSFKEPISNQEPVTIFEKIKKKVTKKTSEDQAEKPKKKRGRPRKNKEAE